MKLFVFSLFLLFSFTTALYGQNRKICINDIIDIAQAEKLIQSKKINDAYIFQVKPEVDTSEVEKLIRYEKKGFVFKKGQNSYKILAIDSALSFRISYIYISSVKYSVTEIDSIQNLIIAKYNSGISFFDLNKEYNDDGNVGGDTKWFRQRTMVPDFEKGIIDRKKGEIFKVYSKNENWHHVVLKTHDNTFVKYFTILVMKSCS
jgi:hypothetical protein